VKKLFFLVAFVSSTTVGGACSSELKAACEAYVEAREACEARTPPDPEDLPKYSVDMCANIDPECQAFFECAVLAAPVEPEEENLDFCNVDRNSKKSRLDLRALNAQLLKDSKEFGFEYVECREPENKACTDADLRP
jgi:hypothetical protein